MAFIYPSTWPPKDPDEKLDYDLDWTVALVNGDTIASSVWTVERGTVVIDSDQFSNTATKVWLTGGVVGERCVLTNHVVTASAREMDRSVPLTIKAK